MNKNFSQSLAVTFILSTVFVLSFFIPQAPVQAGTLCEAIENLISIQSSTMSVDQANAARTVAKCPLPPVIPVTGLDVHVIGDEIDVESVDDSYSRATGNFRFKINSPDRDLYIYKGIKDSAIKLYKNGVHVGSPSFVNLKSNITEGADTEEYFFIGEGDSRVFMLEYAITPVSGTGFYKAVANRLQLKDWPDYYFDDLQSESVFLMNDGIATTSLSFVSLIDKPNLSLIYDTNQSEAILTSDVDLFVTAGTDSDLKIYKYFHQITYVNSETPEKNFYSTFYLSQDPNSTGEETDPDGNVYFTVRAGHTSKFTAQSSVNPKILFAGNYRAQFRLLRVLKDNNNNEVSWLLMPENLSNDKTIVGEISPYISGLSPQTNSDGTKVLGIYGERLLGSTNYGQHAVCYVGNNDAYEITTPVGNMTNGNDKVFYNINALPAEAACSIQLQDLKTGNSNIVYFTVPEGPVVLKPTISLKYKTISDRDFISGNVAPVPAGTEVLFKWETKNTTSCFASANPAVSTWTGLKSVDGLGSIGKADIGRTYTLTCSGPGGKVSSSIDTHPDGQEPPVISDCMASWPSKAYPGNNLKFSGSEGVNSMNYTQNGKEIRDSRFLCSNSKFYACGWELTDSEIARKAQDGQKVGEWTCNLGAKKWSKVPVTPVGENCKASWPSKAYPNIKLDFSGTHDKVSMNYVQNGKEVRDSRFVCNDGKFYACGWELTDSEIAKNVQGGTVVGSWKCDLGNKKWLSSGATSAMVEGDGFLATVLSGFTTFINSISFWK